MADRSGDRPRMRRLREAADRRDVICAAARFYAGECESLEAFLDDLQAARELLDLPQPAPETIRSARRAWAAASLENPVEHGPEDHSTESLAPHARARLQLLCRQCADGGATAGPSYVLVVLSELGEAARAGALAPLVAETVRSTFDRCELVTSWGVDRLLAVVERDPFTENRVHELEWLLRRRLPVTCVPKIHARDLPGTDDELFDVLAELTLGRSGTDGSDAS